MPRPSRADGTSPRQLGTNPRAQATDPRSNGLNPRATGEPQKRRRKRKRAIKQDARWSEANGPVTIRYEQPDESPAIEEATIGGLKGTAAYEVKRLEREANRLLARDRRQREQQATVRTYAEHDQQRQQLSRRARWRANHPT